MKSFIVTDSLQNEVTGLLTYDPNTNTAEFTASTPLAASSQYSATITVDVTDVLGNHMASDFSWSFTTGLSGEIEAPTVLSVSPLDGATDVNVNSTISATFSEPMDPNSLVG